MRERYRAVSSYLEKQDETYKFEAYPHGSFALGTVTRPYINDADADYDVDIVNECKALHTDISPDQLKSLTGDWLKSNGTYKPLLDEEGARCWTLEYSDKSPSFHVDVLPVCLDSSETTQRLISDSINPEIAESALKLTHLDKEGKTYSYLNTNPKGYQKWFAERQSEVLNIISETQKRTIFSEQVDLVREYNFTSYDELPDELVRTPLQRAVQILKRHRDVRFSGRDNLSDKPISVVITTICGLLYEGENNIYDALTNIVSKIDVYSPLLESRHIFSDSLEELGVISRTHDGKWKFSNPVEPEENFAEKWHENGNAKATAFFEWVKWVKQDFLESDETENLKTIFGNSRFEKAIIGTSFLGLDALDAKEFPRISIQSDSVNQPYAR
jgi:hypothetical protein